MDKMSPATSLAYQKIGLTLMDRQQYVTQLAEDDAGYADHLCGVFDRVVKRLTRSSGHLKRFKGYAEQTPTANATLGKLLEYGPFNSVYAARYQWSERLGGDLVNMSAIPLQEAAVSPLLKLPGFGRDSIKRLKVFGFVHHHLRRTAGLEPADVKIYTPKRPTVNQSAFQTAVRVLEDNGINPKALQKPEVRAALLQHLSTLVK